MAILLLREIPSNSSTDITDHRGWVIWLYIGWGAVALLVILVIWLCPEDAKPSGDGINQPSSETITLQPVRIPEAAVTANSGSSIVAYPLERNAIFSPTGTRLPAYTEISPKFPAPAYHS
ncbi:hypothetical protein M422DRAFT_273895 [Sphaerobolus stellatus SS14]|uniref:Unplaced genomic scaffold SPHSTscaffold_355, whole genome shotgun sequence n=1 Tax=Sphaerobolus stellatus (strain SS14) TaxID=990650 RepID=A0A0C9T816_SPHS4|nr:hypothetical protein M422DRAFT_273895 [Sphaerobolus stellatus SS14]